MSGPITPPKLQRGDHVRVVAPSRSLAIIGDDTRRIADRRLAELGLSVSFGAHVDEIDEFSSTSAEHRAADLMDAFTDPTVNAILTVIGGYNSNELLELLDWNTIRDHPTILCGYSDITALQLAILRHCDLITYSGPHYSTFGMERHFDQTLDWFQRCLFEPAPLELEPSATWSDDAWFLDQGNRVIEPNPGWRPLQPGRAAGSFIGGNLATMSALFGTPHLPDLNDRIIWIEDDLESPPWTFRRNVVALTQQPGFDRIAGVVIGRFQRLSGVEPLHVERIVSACLPDGIPVLAGVDVGHTDPMLTLPVGGTVELIVDGEHSGLRLLHH